MTKEGIAAVVVGEDLVALGDVLDGENERMACVLSLLMLIMGTTMIS